MTAQQRVAASERRRGRPAAQPASPLAIFIAGALTQRGLSRDEFAVRLHISSSALSRLLAGKTRWTRVAPHTIANALGLSDDERAHILELCAQQQPEQRKTSSQLASAEPRLAAGRPARAATSAIGLLIEPLIRERGITRSALAHALGVTESTVTRMMSGAHASSHAISAQGISAALGLEEMTRRLFLEQALALGAFALGSGQSAPPMLRYSGYDLAQFDDELVSAQRLLEHGSATAALARSRELYRAILKAPFSRTHQAAARRRVDSALLLGRAQEAALPWGATRTGPTIETYNHVDREILSRFAIGPFAHYYARLFERRAPLYRELEDYAESIRQFTYAIELCMPSVDDLALLVALYRNRAHVWAVQGKEREWRRDIESARRAADRALSDERHRLEGLILYSEAEGFKRLAGVVPAQDTRRQRAYAEAAVSAFSAARTMTQDEGESHGLLLDVSLAQTYVWLDADESARRALVARERASLIYPALLRKSELALAKAKRMSGR